MKVKIRDKKFETIKINGKPVGVKCKLRVYVDSYTGRFGGGFFKEAEGISHCSENDTFDFNKGKKLAETRATFNAVSNIKKDVLNEYGEVLKEFTNGKAKIDRMIFSEKSHTKYLKEKFNE